MSSDRAASNDPGTRAHQRSDTTAGTSEPVRVRAADGGRLRLSVPWLARQPGFAHLVTEKLAHAKGVRSVRVFPRTGNVLVWADGSNEPNDLIKILQAPPASPPAGQVPPRQAPASLSADRVVTGALVLGGAAVAGVLLRRALVGRGASGLYGVVAALIGFPFLRRATRDLTGRTGLGTDALVTAAAVVSLVLRQNVVAMAVLTVLNLGELIQALLLRNSRGHAARHASAIEQRAWLVCDGAEVEVAASQVEVGDVEAVSADHRIPVDGKVLEGSALIDLAAVTGDLVPVPVRPGDQVQAGSRVRSGTLRVLCRSKSHRCRWRRCGRSTGIMFA